MKNIIFLLFALFSTIPAFAQETGTISDPILGISFKIPDGWVGQESGEYFVMGHNSVPGMIIMSMHQNNLEQLKQEARNGIHDPESSISLTLASEIEQPQANAIAATLKGTVNWQAAKAYVIALENKFGTGISIAVITTADLFEQKHIAVAKQIMNSVKFTKPKTDAIVKEWKDFLSNVRLTYMYSNFSGSYTDGGVSAYAESNETIDLCSAGYFTHSSNSMVSAGNSGINAYSGNQGGGDGNWEITVGVGGVPYLVLNFNNGEVYEYKLTYEDQKLHLNGTRYFRTTEGEYRPNCY